MTKPSVDEVAQGIRLHQKVVEDSLLAAAYAVKNAGGAGSTFHQEKSFEEILKLKKGHDCCYDLPGIGLCYLLWYHPRRLNEAIGRFLPLLLKQQEPLHIIDIGCGTAATASAVFIICAQMKKMNMTVPRVHIRGLDSSPSMLKTGNFVMNYLQSSIDEDLRNFISWSFSSGRWSETEVNNKIKDIWFHGGYLFDSSDKNFTQETANIFSVRSHLVNAKKIILTTALSKKLIIDKVKDSLRNNGFIEEPEHHSHRVVFSGPLKELRDFRKNLYSAINVSSALLHGVPLWKSDSDHTVEMSFKLGPGPKKLFPELPSGLVLDLVQDEAAQPENRLTVVQGAAGSGKSTVLAERVARQVKEHSLANRKFTILVTSFNKQMIRQIHEWVNSQVSSVEGYKDEGGKDGDLTIKFKFGSVRFLNFDKIFRRIFGSIPHLRKNNPTPSIQTRLSDLRKNNPQLIDQLGNYDDEEFLEAELRRVIYGLDVRSKSDYLNVKRTGRKRGINKQKRAAVWDVLMGDGGCDVYTQHRIKVLNHFRKPIADGESFMIAGTRPMFSQVFVDECQDMVPADVKIIRGLVADPNHLFFAGDSAQAMHVGIAYALPGLRGRNWKIVNLESSYRLPQRVVEAIGGIASALKNSDLRHEVVVPKVTKSGVLGTRPIVVAYSDYLVEQLTEILVEYGPMIANCSEITVAESKASSKIFIAAVAAALIVGKTAINEMMAAIKGLERSFVIWSTREVWGSDETVMEFVYTVLTRSTGITVIVIEEDTAIEVAECLKLLRRDRLLFWDSAAESAYDKLNV